MTEEIKKCPFCGADGEIAARKDRTVFRPYCEIVDMCIVRCTSDAELGCPAVGGTYFAIDAKIAIEAWNRRV